MARKSEIRVRPLLSVVFLALLAGYAAPAYADAGISILMNEAKIVKLARPADTIVVGTGVTLWDIASARAEGGDVRDMMSTIQQLNHLESGMLVAGQRLRVPADS